jgi:hypothetical protein
MSTSRLAAILLPFTLRDPSALEAPAPTWPAPPAQTAPAPPAPRHQAPSAEVSPRSENAKQSCPAELLRGFQTALRGVAWNDFEKIVRLSKALNCQL